METHLITIGVDQTEYTDPLNCCKADAELIRDTFMEYFNLDENNIQELPNFAARTESFKAIIRNKKKALKDGGNLIVFFSGHGGQATDYNGDETEDQDESIEGEEERYDSTLCFADRMFLDDEVFNLFCEFEENVNILFISDSCHSGSVYRSPDQALPVGAKFFKESVEKGTQWKDIYKDIEILPKEALKASLFFMSACQDREYAYTGNPYSIFTRSIVNHLVLAAKSDMSFKEFAELVILDFNQYQNINPNLEIKGNMFDEQSIKSLLTQKVAKNISDKILWEGEIILTSDTLVKAKEILESYDIVDFDDLDKRTTSFFLNKEKYGIGNGTLLPFLKELHQSFDDEGVIAFLEPEVVVYDESIQQKSSDGEDPNDPIENWAMPGNVKDKNLLRNPMGLYKDADHTALNDALEFVRSEIKEEDRKVRIAIIDTGFLVDYPTRPKHLNVELGRSYYKSKNGEEDFSCVDNGGNNNFHGVATTTILAGSSMKTPVDGIFKGEEQTIGACPYAEVIPIRIANDVVIFGGVCRALCHALDYIIGLKVDVISMSMGGVPSNAVLERINTLYDQGVVIVTAAGNNFKTIGDAVIPEEVIYPSRHKRVITACGVTYNNGPYDFKAQQSFPKNFKGGKNMQGNSGPAEVMEYALAAYTPNIPWASVSYNEDGSRHDFLSIRGGGTSSATPQIAAAAALYITYYRKELAKLPEAWMRGEAVREALFVSADESKYEESRKFYGNGILNAREALNLHPKDLNLNKVKKDTLPPLTLFKYLDLYF